MPVRLVFLDLRSLGGVRSPRDFQCHASLRPSHLIQLRTFSQLLRQQKLAVPSIHQNTRVQRHRSLRLTQPLYQLRFYSPRRPPILTQFPQFTPRPITRTKTFWIGLGFLGLLIWSPIPGWVMLGGICYGFYRLFRSLRRTSTILGPRNGLLSTEGDGLSFIDSLFARDPRTREVSAKIQEMAMERVEEAIEANEEDIRRVFPVQEGEMSGEFHFTFPTEVSMVNDVTQFLGQSMVDFTFEVQIKFMVYLALEEGRKGAEVIARADVNDEGVKLTWVDVRDVRGGRKVRLKGVSDGGGGGGNKPEVKESIVRGEGEGKTIDATTWSSR